METACPQVTLWGEGTARGPSPGVPHSCPVLSLQVHLRHLLASREKEQKFPAAVLQQLERGGHAQQTAPDASRLRAKTRRRQTHRRGSPTLDTAAARWEAQETPGSRRKPPGTQSPPAAPIWGRTWGPDACRNQGLPKIPGGGITSQRGTQPVQGAREHSVCPNPAPWCCSASGCGVPGEEPSGGPRLRGAGRRQRP
ncbi:uncharacterized protein LOC134738743 isoform X2 [Pongo pygmaeus]|uniref:uncharacterized protein LOC134738743 isoform X2 n=1 Tax=Pongo pygmaeus TaxID=9600 RepID=UPI00300D3417